LRRRGEYWGVYACVGLGGVVWGCELATVVGQQLEEKLKRYVGVYGGQGVCV
jgi:hypothetical protein